MMHRTHGGSFNLNKLLKKLNNLLKLNNLQCDIPYYIQIGSLYSY